jgi:hypothetical protein
MRIRRHASFAILLLAALVLAGGPARGAQEPDIATRDMNASAFFKSRPESKGTRRARMRRYRPVEAASSQPAKPAEPPSDAEIGFTIWRLRPAEPGDALASRDITHDEGGTARDFVSERIAGGPELSLGQRFRFAIETPRKGYLYVVNRPHYDDGPRDPVLIFPTLRIRGGSNEVRGGRLVELPSRWDSPPFYRITERAGARLVGEEVIVLVTPKPLDLAIGPRPQALTSAQVAAWAERWGARVETLEAIDRDARAYTPEERTAGADGDALLTRDDPGPQTIYRIAAKPDDPLFLRVMIRIRGEAGDR